jgi:hypothetical protein
MQASISLFVTSLSNCGGINDWSPSPVKQIFDLFSCNLKFSTRAIVFQLLETLTRTYIIQARIMYIKFGYYQAIDFCAVSALDIVPSGEVRGI